MDFVRQQFACIRVILGCLLAASLVTPLCFAQTFAINEKVTEFVQPGGVGLTNTYHQDPINLGDKLLFLVDQENNLTLSDILSNNHQLKWRTNNSAVPSYGYSAAAYWFRITLFNDTEEKVHRIIEVEYPLIDYLDLAIISTDGNLKQYQTGTALPFDSRPIKHRNFLFPVDIPANETTELIFRIKSDQAIQLPLKLWTNNHLLEVDETILLVHGLYFGLMLVMALYNLFLYLFTKDLSYLFYVCFVSSITLFQATQQGLSFQFIWPSATSWHANSTAILILAAILFAMLFVNKFLDLSVTDRISHYYTTLIGLTACLLIVAILFVPATTVMQLGILLAIPTCIGALVIGIRSWYRGHKQARYYIIAWAIFLVGTVALSLNKFGWLPRSFITEYSSQIGSGLEVILLAIALADRINHQRRATELAQERALVNEMFARELEEKAKERLERSVAERTRELSLAMKKLSDANKALENLSTTDGLTQVKNRRFFNLTIIEEWKRATRNSYPLSLLFIDLDHFKQINDRYGHMVGDECLIQAASVVESQSRRMEDSVCRYGGEEFAVILPNIDSQTAVSIAEKIRVAIEEIEFCRDGNYFNLTASIGISSITPDPENGINSLITQADSALYQAKDAGRNCCMIYGDDALSHKVPKDATVQDKDKDTKVTSIFRQTTRS